MGELRHNRGEHTAWTGRGPLSGFMRGRGDDAVSAEEHLSRDLTRGDARGVRRKGAPTSAAIRPRGRLRARQPKAISDRGCVLLLGSSGHPTASSRSGLRLAIIADG